MKRVALATTSYPDRIVESGQEAAGAFVADFAEALAQHCEVHVVAAADEDHVDAAGRLTTHRFQVPQRPLSLLRAASPSDWPKIWASLRAGQRALDRVVDEVDFDHIFALWALPSGYWARRAGRRRGVPYSTWALGSDIWSLGKLPVVSSILRGVLRGAARRYADGLVLADDVAALSGMSCDFLPSSRRLETAPGALRGEPPYRLAFLGRWHPNKGADLLLDALAELDDVAWAKIEEVRYCGGGPLEEQVRAGVAELSAAGRPIALRGYLDRAQAVALYQWADYLIIPSRIESIPVIFSDAMQCGVPLVSTPVGDLPRLIESYAVGVLAEQATAAALADALRRALHSSPSAVASGLDRARNDFDVTAAAARFYSDTLG